ncbi:MAG: hypothetical protein JSS53_01290 [Proteobacteria bacterium]|nr:hypothetical protein [Pseudomonadota bacterium]
MKPKLMLNNTTLVVQAALSDLGFIWVDEKIAFDLVIKKKLASILDKYMQQLSNICLFYENQNKSDPRIRAFIDFFIKSPI